MNKQPQTHPVVKKLFGAVVLVTFSRKLFWVCSALSCIVGIICLILRFTYYPVTAYSITLVIIFFASLAFVLVADWIEQWATEKLEECNWAGPDAISPLLLALDNVNPQNEKLISTIKNTLAALLWKLNVSEHALLEDWHFERLRSILDEQKISRLLRAVQYKDILPPWEQYPETEPWWIGWRQGDGEVWLKLVWLPFWSKLARTEKEHYVDRWAAPEEWRNYVLEGWGQGKDAEHKLAEFVLNKDKFTTPEQ